MQVDLLLINFEKGEMPQHEPFIFLSSLIVVFILASVSFLYGVACLGNASNILFELDDIFAV